MHGALILITIVLLICKLAGLAIAWWVVFIPLMLIAAFWLFMFGMLILGLNTLTKHPSLKQVRRRF